MDKENRDQGILGGLKAAFSFLIAFSLLHYSIPLSILLAIIGGIAVGLILSWWHSKEPAQPKRQFKLEKMSLQRHYPSLKQIASHTARKGSLNKRKSSEETPED